MTDLWCLPILQCWTCRLFEGLLIVVHNNDTIRQLIPSCGCWLLLSNSFLIVHRKIWMDHNAHYLTHFYSKRSWDKWVWNFTKTNGSISSVVLCWPEGARWFFSWSELFMREVASQKWYRIVYEEEKNAPMNGDCTSLYCQSLQCHGWGSLIHPLNTTGLEWQMSILYRCPLKNKHV